MKTKYIIIIVLIALLGYGCYLLADRLRKTKQTPANAQAPAPRSNGIVNTFLDIFKVGVAGAEAYSQVNNLSFDGKKSMSN